MKYFLNLIDKHRTIVLGICVFIALLLHLEQIKELPCFNADEASFAYNAYSITQTGRDEYGEFMPLRFKSFGENKLPVTIYLITPFVSLFGLSETVSRLPFIIIGILSPIFFYILSYHLFKNKYVGYLAAFLSAISPWIQIMSRHIHENVIILLLTLLMLIYLIKLVNNIKMRYVVIIAVLIGISLFTYHIGKVMAVYFFIATLITVFTYKVGKKTFSQFALILLAPIIIFGITEILTPTNRVANLLFTSNIGFTLTIEEKLREHGIRLIHNKGTEAIQTLTHRYLTYFSPEFLIIEGDDNKRFGHKGISPITPLEYFLFFVGLYYLFKNKNRYRFIVTSFLLTAPLSASLAWAEHSLTRSFMMVIPMLLLSSYGLVSLVNDIQYNKWRYLTAIGMFLGILYFAFFSWEYYYYHYMKKPDVVTAWQCGYKELTTYLEENKDNFNKFHITKKHGQPYMFTLFFQKYPPSLYQEQAQLGELDEYGFGQVEGYDNYSFEFKTPFNKNEAYIGYPDDFNGSNIPEKSIKKIKYNNQDIFWIYEAK